MLAITGAIQGTSKQRIFDELGLISLRKRCWYKKLIFFYKIVNGLLPDNLQYYKEVPSQDNYPLRSASTRQLKPLPSRSKSFKKAFFPYCIDEWNRVNPEVGNAKSMHKFKIPIKIEKFKNSLYNVYDPLGVKLLSRLRLQFSHLNEHESRHGFKDTTDPTFPCGTEVETNHNFLLRCRYFFSQRPELFDNLYNLDPSFSKLNNKEKVAYLLYSSTSNPNTLNKVFINLVIKLLELTGRFDKPLTFDQRKVFFLFSFYSFSFLAEIILSLNIIIYIWLLFQENSRTFLAECDT